MKDNINLMPRNENSFFSKLGEGIFYLIGFTVRTFCLGLLAYFCWTWFAVAAPLCLPAISIFHAAGIMFLLSIPTLPANARILGIEKDMEIDLPTSTFFWYMSLIYMLMIIPAYIVHLAMIFFI